LPREQARGTVWVLRIPCRGDEAQMLHGYGDAVAPCEGPASARRQRRRRPTHACVRVRPVTP